MEEEQHDKASKLKGLLWLIGGAGLAGIFALGIGPFARAIPWSWEERAAREIPANTVGECKANPKAEALLQKLVTRIYPLMPDDKNFSVSVQAVHDEQVNAFATLGGKIYLNSGLLAQAHSAEEVAGVLAHEIEHVHRRHIIQGVATRMLTAQGLSMVFSGGADTSAADWAQYFLTMNFTRQQEDEADRGGLARLQQAHVDNKGFREFFERMEEEDGTASKFLSDHPSSQSRAELVKEFPNSDVKTVLAPEEWAVLKTYCR